MPHDMLCVSSSGTVMTQFAIWPSLMTGVIVTHGNSQCIVR